GSFAELREALGSLEADFPWRERVRRLRLLHERLRHARPAVPPLVRWQGLSIELLSNPVPPSVGLWACTSHQRTVSTNGATATWNLSQMVLFRLRLRVLPAGGYATLDRAGGDVSPEQKSAVSYLRQWMRASNANAFRLAAARSMLAESLDAPPVGFTR